jgi:hypothetical protein
MEVSLSNRNTENININTRLGLFEQSWDKVKTKRLQSTLFVLLSGNDEELN